MAEAAQTTHASVSYHFGSRDALILEAAARANAESLADTSFETPPRRAADFARELPDRAQREAHDHAFQFELAWRRAAGPTSARRSGPVRGYLAASREALRALGILGEDETGGPRLLFAAIDGLMLQQLIFEDPERTRDALAILQRLLGELQERADDGHSTRVGPSARNAPDRATGRTVRHRSRRRRSARTARAGSDDVRRAAVSEG